jgi:glyceraldehyde 3-phosphate dehydrogenase
MKKTFAINGFGRIGRTSFRLWWEQYRNDLELVAINTSGSMPLKDWVHLLKNDSSYGHFDPGITYEEQQTNKETTDDNPVLGTLTIADRTITVLAQRDPAKIPWEKLGVEIVLEATGKFLTQDDAGLHLQAGAKKVLLSAPGKSDGISTSVLGVNEFDQTCDILSNASCTTNCVAPVVQVMKEKLGIKKAILSTIHAYTDGQNLMDNSHKDLRRARAAAVNIIPTSTGAAKATTKIIPELKGLFDGIALRVPVLTGSLADITFVASKKTSVEEVNQILTEAAQSERWRGILAVTNEPLVSSDIVGRDEASIVDLELTQVIGDDLVKVVSWYDNEWGYCARLMDQLKKL